MSAITDLLGSEADTLLDHQAKVSRDLLHLPGPDFVERIWVGSDRNRQVLRNIQSIYDHGRLGGTDVDEGDVAEIPNPFHSLEAEAE